MIDTKFKGNGFVDIKSTTPIPELNQYRKIEKNMVYKGHILYVDVPLEIFYKIKK